MQVLGQGADYLEHVGGPESIFLALNIYFEIQLMCDIRLLFARPVHLKDAVLEDVQKFVEKLETARSGVEAVL